MPRPAPATRRPTRPRDRLPGPDVVRAVALIGVVVMNYHGYLILRGAPQGDGWADDLFDPWSGPLSTRFAATFVLTAGVGVTLMTRRAVADRADGVEGASARVTEMRWRLVRRGLALYVLGLLLDEIWPGTIIVYYGAMFALAAALFTLRSRWVLAVGAAAVLAGWAVNTWVFWRNEDGESTQWLEAPGPNSIRKYVFDVFVNGTHPLLPWLVFFCVGIVIGRVLGSAWWRPLCLGSGLTMFAAASIASSSATTEFQIELLSRHPGERGLVYVASALGSALVAFAGISWIADTLAANGNTLLDPLRRAGQMTLTLYIAHILIFNLFVDWLDVVQPDGLATALVFALAFWVVAIIAASEWQRRYGRGPAEIVYRKIGG